MREILYKGFHKDENGTEKIFVDGKWVKGEWVYGYYIRYGWTHQEKDYIVPLYASALYAKEVIPSTVGQYTGLTDKYGKKIFDGDILHFKAYRGGGFACPIGTDIYYRVLFGHCNPDMNTLTEYVGFWALGKNYDEDDLYEYGNSISYLVDSHGACVIGNIHDNPELLERSDSND